MANSFTRPPRVVGGNKQAISAKDFNALSRAIEELQNAINPIGLKAKKRQPPPHPWKAGGKGGLEITVAPGKVLGFKAAATTAGKPWHCVFASYAGGDVAVSASGWLYVVATVTDAAIEADTYLLDGAFFIVANTQKPTSVTVVYSATAPASITSGTSSEIYIPLAEVTVTDGVASVVDQVLTHNPCLFAEVGHIA